MPEKGFYTDPGVGFCIEDREYVRLYWKADECGTFVPN